MKDKTYKILIVDDERDILDSLQMTLKDIEEFKSEISIATDGESALNKMLTDDFDLILTDYRMPGMNGIDLLTQVNERYPKTARILITGYSDLDIAIDAINKANVDYYIEKPCVKDKLITTVLGALRKKQQGEIYHPSVQFNNHPIDNSIDHPIDYPNNHPINHPIDVDNVNKALKAVKNAQSTMINNLPGVNKKQIIILEFKSSDEFNIFSTKIRQMKNISIDNLDVFENKYIVKIGIYLESFEKII